MKKKYLNLALIYAIFAMIGGVFYREFTKFYHFTKVTTLGKVHTHLFILGTFVYLFIAIFSNSLAFNYIFVHIVFIYFVLYFLFCFFKKYTPLNSFRTFLELF